MMWGVAPGQAIGQGLLPLIEVDEIDDLVYELLAKTGRAEQARALLGDGCA